jgi:succinate-semialdehyde dehydrogenase/glutarate-semialdehyde dehydrogenase
MATNVELADPSLFIGRNYINGQWLEATSGKRFSVTGLYDVSLLALCQQHADIALDPATGAVLGSCPESDIEDVGRAIKSAAAALPLWRTHTNRTRSRILRRWHDLVFENRDDLARLITLENGKAKPDAIGEVAFGNSFLEWYSEEAARIYGDVIPHSAPGFRASVLKEPIGVCGIIVP